jgi:hypothetical protein
MAEVIVAITLMAGMGVLGLTWAFSGYYNDEDEQNALKNTIADLEKEKTEVEIRIKTETSKDALAALKEKERTLTTEILKKTVELQQLQINSNERNAKLYRRIDILT